MFFEGISQVGEERKEEKASMDGKKDNVFCTFSTTSCQIFK